LAQEITERKKAEESVLESRAKLETALASMTEAIFIADAEGRFVNFIDEFIRYHRFKNREACSKEITECPNYLDAYFGDGTPAPVEMWAMSRALRGETGSNVEYMLRRKATGETWWGNYNFGPIRDSNGKITGATVTTNEITQRKKTDEALKRYTAELEVSNKELEAFAYSVSHDLRAPLRTLDGFSQAVLDDYGDKLDDTGKDYLRRVRDAAKHMDQITRDMLTLSRVIRSELRIDDVNLSNIVSTIAKELSEKEPTRKVEFIISPDVMVKGDASLLQMALYNLLENSWKFTAKIKEARIEFGTVFKDNERIYFVRDNGVGFNMQYVDKLFQPFQRLHTEDEYPGTGIGLATVQRVIRRHGGRIWAESQLGKGTTIYFTLG